MENFELIDGLLVTESEILINDLGGSQPVNEIGTVVDVEDCEDYDLENLKKLLMEFSLMQLLPVLQASNLTYRCLQYVRKEDLIEAIPHLGLRIEFREKLFMWRKKEFGMDDETISNPTKVQEWINRDFPNVGSTISSASSTRRVLNKDLLDILSQRSKGQSCLHFYKENKILTDNRRDDIINIITEEIVCSEKSVKPNDFLGIVDDICEIFPSEVTAKEYYYIPRQGKKNPSGKLYSKYVNARCKRTKKTDHSTATLQNEDKSDKVEDLDESIAVALKTSLNRDSSNWQDVCEKWKKTYVLRQKDLKHLSSIDFLSAWSKYSDSRAPELIKIDFNIMYPGKEFMLYTKWDKFKEKIKIYFSENIHSNYCKQMLSIANSTKNKDAEDYILATLLAGVMLPSTRFKDEDGKLKKKITIIDAQESFLLRLISLNNYENEIGNRISKYYSVGLTIQPFIIAEGASDDAVKSFYVYFDKTLYKFSSFIESLDICFKIFHVFSLKYPQACEASWVLIQKFFFEIFTAHDIKSSKITSLLTFMNTQ